MNGCVDVAVLFCIGVVYIFIGLVLMRDDLGAVYAVCGILDIVIITILTALAGENILLLIWSLICEIQNLFISLWSNFLKG